MSKKYFGTDGIRGRANTFPITAEIVMKVGMAAGILFHRGNYRHRVVIGKDTRLSGYMIENALVAGFTAAGMDVLLLGPVPTPAVAMLTKSMRCDIGVMISASHNAFSDNGIKLFGPDGYKLSDEIEERIEVLIDQDVSMLLADSDKLGRASRVEGVVDRYVEFAKRTLPQGMSLEGVRIVVDCANGAAYKAAPAVLWELGAEVITIGDRPNGFNINEGCGSVDTERLCRKVHEMRADIGVALDGDADRVLIVDERSRVIDGDQIMAAIAEYWKNISQLKGGGVVATVMSNIGLERFLNGIDLKLARTKVGDRYVVEHMRNHGFNLGGEQSGHMVMSDFTTTGDGIIAALQVLSVVRYREKSVSEVCDKFEPVPQVLRNIHCSDNNLLKKQLVIKAIEDGHSQLSKMGRLLIRCSGTEPLIRVMAEGDDEVLINKIVDDVVGALENAST